MSKHISVYIKRPILLLVFAGFIISCGGTVQIKASAERHQVKQTVLPLTAGKKINVTGFYKTAQPVTIYEHANGTKWEGDLKQYTDVAVNILKKELTKRGVVVTDQTLNTLELKISDVHSPKKAQAFDKTMSLKLEVFKGNGKTTTINTTYRTPGSASRAVDGAIIAAITQMLKSEAVVGYINR